MNGDMSYVNHRFRLLLNTASPASPPGDWQLAAGHYVSTSVTGMTPEITHPRPNTETSSDAYCRNAYTGMKWEIPIVVQGGSWPFKYELTDNTYVSGTGVEGTDYPTGMSVGETLSTSGDEQIVGAAYGVLSWTSPTGTSETIYILVTDQDGNTDTVTITIAIGTSNFVFIDGDAASEGVGTIGDPLKTFASGLWASGNGVDDGFAGKIAVFRAAATAYVIEDGAGGEAISDSTYKPRTYIAYPGESVTWDMSTARMQVNTCDDFFLGDIDCDGSKALATNWRAFYLNDKSDRCTFFRNSFDNMDNGTSGTDNPGCIVTWGLSANPTPVHEYISIVRNTCGVNNLAPLYTGFDVNKIVVEHNISNQTTVEGGGNKELWIKFKANHNNGTIRANVATSFTALDGDAIVLGRLNSGDFCVNQEACWNTIVDTTVGGSGVCIYSNLGTGDLTGSYVYRNTLVSIDGYAYRGLLTTSLDRTQVINNIAYGGTDTFFNEETADGVNYDLIDNNLASAAEPVPHTESNPDLDSVGNLVDTGLSNNARTDYLGTRGSEVA